MDNGYIPPAGLAWAIWGDILRERNLLDQADQYIQTGVNLASEGGLVDDLQHALFYQARIKLALGDHEVARQTMRRSTLMMRAYRVTRLTALSQALEARMALALGNLAEASSWANNVKNEVLLNTSYSYEREKLTVARVWLTESKLSEAQELLQTVCKVAREEKRDGTLLEALILLALIKWQSNDVQETCKVISESIRLAKPQGYVRIFLDEGEALRQILEACKNDETVTQYRFYIEQILNAYAASPEGTPVGLLSPQENRILGLLAKGASNQAIASTLFISVGTVKWHVHNIYEKLGVSSRTQAINRGRDLNYIK